MSEGATYEAASERYGEALVRYGRSLSYGGMT